MCINCSVSQVCVARWNSQTCRDTLLTQDLVHGEGQTVSMGDTVEVALSCWLLQNHVVGQVWACLHTRGFVCEDSSKVFTVLDLHILKMKILVNQFFRMVHKFHK